MSAWGIGRLLVALGFMLLPVTVRAQAALSGGIAGVVRDSTGAVLPGVTVEATSPALIEKVRAVVTDSQGQYKIVELRPGTYAVTFTLPGFSRVRREGVELATGFTAAVNAELSVGLLAETITVSGASPVVDVQNTQPQVVLQRAELDSLPRPRAEFLVVGMAAPSSWVGWQSMPLRDHDLADSGELARARRSGRGEARQPSKSSCAETANTMCRRASVR